MPPPHLRTEGRPRSGSGWGHRIDPDNARIASALIHGPNSLAAVGFVEDSDWESASQI